MNCEQAALLRLLIFIFVVIVNYFWIILSVDLIYLISTWNDHGVKLFRRKRNTLFIFLIQMLNIGKPTGRIEVQSLTLAYIVPNLA